MYDIVIYIYVVYCIIYFSMHLVQELYAARRKYISFIIKFEDTRELPPPAGFPPPSGGTALSAPRSGRPRQPV